ncbi:amidohydrolase family protein [Methylopila sp. Yamaguchi]|uniref:amidohydrolase family protein n=1 Tax=Methylopila sp. Yamaguchi TaxID=1437817 RepID=UPI000CAFEE15|nr:amidohydrolase family protein [Methylopila sp. Yamaguchi]GBD49913.1 amidohydrolase 2 [Methylopila sp. Yamaguchi]
MRIDRPVHPPRGEPPVCPGPAPAPHAATRFDPPPGSVDCHAHVIGLPPAYPFVAERSYTPPEATPAAYLRMLDATGMTYGVLVQVSAHGTDNRLMLRTLAANPDRLRGVAVIPPKTSERDLAALAEAGVVGLRLNVLFGGGVGFDKLETYGAIAREMGWHLQFLLDAADLPILAPRLKALPVPFVVDHMGHMPTSRGRDDAGFRTLVGLAADGAWIKLSGAYRISIDGPPYRDVAPFARALLQAAPERCLWGSDWPHVAHWAPSLDVGHLLDVFADWAPTPFDRARILVENPARLYGFPPVAAAPAPGVAPRAEL